MFGAISRRYDLMNRLMTLGRDRAWRTETVANALSRPGAVLDVATGTGDLALEVLRQHPSAHVVGLDLVPEMLALAPGKAGVEAVQPGWVQGDALRIPFPDAAFDAIVTGFALRNVTSIPAAFAEMARVTRSGGKVACLEMAMPRSPLFRAFFGFYFFRIVPLLGGLITGEPSAYTYLPHSVAAFLPPDQLADLMRRTGWGDVQYHRQMLGTVAIHVGTRI
jgi:demethylmenaquinone methyltransferase/2-methoxy-6-polyprenyl-1,4-benzoquinol methylase